MNTENFETFLQLLNTKVQGIETLVDHLYDRDDLPQPVKDILFLLNNEVGNLKATIDDQFNLLYDDYYNDDHNDNEENNTDDNYEDVDYNYEDPDNDGL